MTDSGDHGGSSGVLTTRQFRPLLYTVAAGSYASGWTHNPSAALAASLMNTTGGAALVVRADGRFTQVGDMVHLYCFIDIDGAAGGAAGANVPGAAGQEVRITIRSPAATDPTRYWQYIPQPEMRSVQVAAGTTNENAVRPAPAIKANLFYTLTTAAGTELLVPMATVDETPRARVLATGVIALTAVDTTAAPGTEGAITRDLLVANPPMGGGVGNRIKIVVDGWYAAALSP